MNIERFKIGIDMDGSIGGGRASERPNGEGGRFDLFPISPFSALEAFKAVSPAYLGHDLKAKSYRRARRHFLQNTSLLYEAEGFMHLLQPEDPQAFLLGATAVHEALRVEAEKRGKPFPRLSGDEVRSFTRTLADPEVLGDSFQNLIQQRTTLLGQGLNEDEVDAVLDSDPEFMATWTQTHKLMRKKFVEKGEEFRKGEPHFMNESEKFFQARIRQVPKVQAMPELAAFVTGNVYVYGVFRNVREIDATRSLFK